MELAWFCQVFTFERLHFKSSSFDSWCVAARGWCVPKAAKPSWRVCAWGPTPPCWSQGSWEQWEGIQCDATSCWWTAYLAGTVPFPLHTTADWLCATVLPTTDRLAAYLPQTAQVRKLFAFMICIFYLKQFIYRTYFTVLIFIVTCLCWWF